jgi:hypothetical protein
MNNLLQVPGSNFAAGTSVNHVAPLKVRFLFVYIANSGIITSVVHQIK